MAANLNFQGLIQRHFPQFTTRFRNPVSSNSSGIEGMFGLYGVRRSRYPSEEMEQYLQKIRKKLEHIMPNNMISVIFLLYPKLCITESIIAFNLIETNELISSPTGITKECKDNKVNYIFNKSYCTDPEMNKTFLNQALRANDSDHINQMLLLQHVSWTAINTPNKLHQYVSKNPIFTENPTILFKESSKAVVKSAFESIYKAKKIFLESICHKTSVFYNDIGSIILDYLPPIQFKHFCIRSPMQQCSTLIESNDANYQTVSYSPLHITHMIRGTSGSNCTNTFMKNDVIWCYMLPFLIKQALSIPKTHMNGYVQDLAMYALDLMNGSIMINLFSSGNAGVQLQNIFSFYDLNFSFLDDIQSVRLIVPNKRMKISITSNMPWSDEYYQMVKKSERYPQLFEVD